MDNLEGYLSLEIKIPDARTASIEGTIASQLFDGKYSIDGTQYSLLLKLTHTPSGYIMTGSASNIGNNADRYTVLCELTGCENSETRLPKYTGNIELTDKSCLQYLIQLFINEAGKVRVILNKIADKPVIYTGEGSLRRDEDGGIGVREPTKPAPDPLIGALAR